MKRVLPVCLMASLLLLMGAQDVAAQWQCLYATWDDETNGTGHNTPAMGLIQENVFVALVMTRGVRNFMIPYYFADSALGRVYSYGYGSATSGIYQVWTDGAFDQVQMFNAFKIATTSDGKIYVANNDPEHNILVFQFDGDTINVPAPYPRVTTGSNGIFGIEVDANGYVYVCTDTSIGVAADVKVYNPIGSWSSNHNDPPVQTINLPDGIYKGITVTPNGQQLFVSDYGNRRILKYVGGPTTGYSLDPGFNFQLSPTDTVPGSGLLPGPMGLAYLASNRILFAAVDAFIPGAGQAYSYGRVYLLNANTGAFVSSDTSVYIVDAAAWNFALTGGYNIRTNGTVPGNASGYTSLHDVEFDELGNLYTQSYYGWTIDKWRYNGTLPIVGVQEIPGEVPDKYELGQNYPNPFNPVTNVEFGISRAGFVTLKVIDVLGREVATLVNEQKGPGTYRVTFDGSGLPSGTYFYTLRAGGHVEMKKMTLLK